jgi:2',3'-cyclic-nucleotide 2'-phosphodiesterase (5'-nucleotidase family)
MKKFIPFLVFLFSSLSYSQDNLKSITILHWNDFHARNMPYKVSKKDTATGDTIFYYVGGTSSMLGYLNKFRTSNSLVLNAGDDFQGTPISTITHGKSQIELLNLYNFDAFVLGNHEFDYGQFSLDSALQLAKFVYLSCNVVFLPKNDLMAKPYVIKDINGVKCGIIGVTLPELFEVSLPANVNQIKMLDADLVILGSIADLKDAGCDVIVLLTHCGVDYDKTLAEKFHRDVDIIVGGHSHTPLFRPLIKDGVVIVQAGAYARWLGKLDVEVDTEKDTVIGYYGKLHETVFDSTIYDQAAQRKVEEMLASIAPELSRVIGKLESDWVASYSKESNLGQFEADAFRIAANTDIAFINGGGLRKGLYRGDITIGDIWEINPFGNTLVVASVPGKTLLQMIQSNVFKRINDPSTEMLNISGATYKYKSKEPGFIQIEINRSLLDTNQTYTIATNNFVAAQFKKFFPEVPDKIEWKETGLIDRDVIIAAIENEKTINSILERRVIDISSP